MPKKIKFKVLRASGLYLKRIIFNFASTRVVFSAWRVELFMRSRFGKFIEVVLGEDEKYKASELDSHGPSVRGWLSNKNCTYPQEILFVLFTPAVVHQIQILAHHYIIRTSKFLSLRI